MMTMIPFVKISLKAKNCHYFKKQGAKNPTEHGTWNKSCCIIKYMNLSSPNMQMINSSLICLPGEGGGACRVFQICIFIERGGEYSKKKIYIYIYDTAIQEEIFAMYICAKENKENSTEIA